jgi:environmental stress-induced protein Ves
MRILRAADRTAVPWKNGGGITREVAVSPDGARLDAFDWRVSIADVRAPGPFSLFPGIDRVLTILEGRMALAFADREVILEAGEPFAFAGDVACFGRPIDGPVTDLNIMTRRGRCSTRVECAADTTVAPNSFTLVVAASDVRLGDVALARFDAAVIDRAHALTGRAVVITIA